ncbi:hypothetical protein BaRGS_00019366, partial [Batillaria attramentaria]
SLSCTEGIIGVDMKWRAASLATRAVMKRARRRNPIIISRLSRCGTRACFAPRSSEVK